jgi:hypothetical protein
MLVTPVFWCVRALLGGTMKTCLISDGGHHHLFLLLDKGGFMNNIAPIPEQ